MNVGILALQGSFAEHARCIHNLGAEPVLVRQPKDLTQIDGLIIPGGESTAICMLLERSGFFDNLRARAMEGFPIFGTCAGLIILARKIDDPPGGDHGVHPIGILNVIVRRNAFGRQLNSFEDDVIFTGVGDPPFRAIFIRAPMILEADTGVHVLSRLNDNRIIAVEQGNLMATAFHPELTGDLRIHEYFFSRIKARS
jgi:5'-phosphate synthase pdxT subunit